MNTKEYSKSNSAYIKPGESSPFTATINDVIESTDFNTNPCLVLDLSNETKIQLKNYQVKELENLFSEETDNWIGKNISVTIGETLYNETAYPKFVFGAADMQPTPVEVPPTPTTDDLPFE